MAESFYTCTWTDDPLPAHALDSYPRKWAALRRNLDHMLTPEWSNDGRPWLTCLVPDKRQATLARSSSLGWAAKHEVELETHYLKTGDGDDESYTLWVRIAEPTRKKPGPKKSSKASKAAAG